MYYRSSQTVFNTWLALANTEKGIPAEGVVSTRSGAPDPTAQRTMEYSSWIQHPDESDDGIFLFGDQVDGAKTSLTQDEVIALGWFPDGAE